MKKQITEVLIDHTSIAIEKLRVRKANRCSFEFILAAFGKVDCEKQGKAFADNVGGRQGSVETAIWSLCIEQSLIANLDGQKIIEISFLFSSCSHRALSLSIAAGLAG